MIVSPSPQPAPTSLPRASASSSLANKAASAAFVLVGSLLLILSAKAQIPFYPVPMTLQTLTVLVLGAVLGARLAGASVALYLAQGLAGLPVFAGALAGPAYFAGPTAGFLIGFLAAALAVGALMARGWGRNSLGLVAVMTLGHAVIFAFGFAWLATLLGPGKAWAVGVAPFAWATLLKTGLAAALTKAVLGLDRRSAR